MDHAAAMRIAQRSQHLLDIFDDVTLRDRSILGDLLQRGTFHKLHHHDQLVVDLEGSMQLCDVRMIETGERANFTDKPVGQIRLGDQVGEKDLHRLRAVRNHVAYAVDASHAAHAQHADDLVVANPLTYIESHKV